MGKIIRIYAANDLIEVESLAEKIGFEYAGKVHSGDNFYRWNQSTHSANYRKVSHTGDITGCYPDDILHINLLDLKKLSGYKFIAQQSENYKSFMEKSPKSVIVCAYKSLWESLYKDKKTRAIPLKTNEILVNDYEIIGPNPMKMLWKELENPKLFGAFFSNPILEMVLDS